MPQKKSRVKIYTDGACLGNPGPGGWGALLVSASGVEKELHGNHPQTTNNQMELQAVISALQALKRPCEVDLYSDSRYVLDGISQWLPNWKRNNWQTANRKPVKNKDYWQALDAEAARHDIHWHWVKGHAGHRENERVDALARNAAEALRDSHKSASLSATEAALEQESGDSDDSHQKH